MFLFTRIELAIVVALSMGSGAALASVVWLLA